MSLNLATILRETAKRKPADEATVIQGTSMSYEMLHGVTQRFAGGLMRLGIHRGQHVALMLPNVPHFTIAYHGAHYVGAPIVPLNVMLTADEIAYHLDDSDAVALVVWEGFFEQARAAVRRASTCKHIIVAKADRSDLAAPEEAHNFFALAMGSEPKKDLADTSADDTAVVLYTSGTTGHPKGAELSHFNLFYNAQYVATTLLPMTTVKMTALVTLPLFHSFGQTCLQNAVLYSGGTLVMLPKFDAEVAFALIAQHKINLFAGVPTMYFALLHHPAADKYDLSSLRYCVSGGAAMPVEVMRAFDEKHKVSTLEGYGLSETSPVASFNVLDRPKKAGSIGLPIWGVEFTLKDERGEAVEAPDVPGEICIKGHNVMKGYYKKPEATADVLKEGWFHTGDIARRDADGYYFIVDRKKDMIIRGGFNVYPREIEEVLYAHPAVAEAAVVGVPHDKFGEEVKAIIARKEDTCTEEDIIEYCRQHLAAYKLPRIVEFRSTLPKGPTGKILKRELRKA